MLYYSDIEENKAAARAQQIWNILIGCAHNQQILTYGQLADILGFKGAGVFAESLGLIMDYCDREGLPPLTSLVVRKVEGDPGSGLTTTSKYTSNDEARMKVFQFEWYKLIPPSIADLA